MVKSSKRGLTGSVLFALSILFFCLAFNSLAYADTSDAGSDCHSKIAKEMAALIDQDQNNILDQQLKLTALKLAAAAKRSRSMTVEKYIQQETAEIEGQDKNGIREKLIQLYQQNGQGADAATAAAEIEPIVEKFQRGSYWNKDLRFKNHELSSYVLAHSLTYPNETPFSQEDAAILWMQSQISEAVTRDLGRGSAAANLQEVSTQVARMTGAIQGAADLSVEELEARVVKVQEDIASQFQALTDQLSVELKTACLTRPDGTVCALSAIDQADVFFKTIEEVTAKLEQDQAYLNQKVVAKLGQKVRDAGANLTIEGVSPAAESMGPKTDLQTVIPKIEQAAPFLAVMQTISQKENAVQLAADAPPPIYKELPVGKCTAKAEPLQRDDGAQRMKITLSPEKDGRKKIEVFAPVIAPRDNTGTDAVIARAMEAKGDLLTPEQKKLAQLYGLNGLRQADALYQQTKDGPCFKPAR